MAVEISEKKIVRAGVFSRVADAQAAVGALRDGGFSEQEISVICSEEHKAKLFGSLAEGQPAKPKGNAALMRAGLMAFGFAITAVIASTVTSTTTAIIAIGALGALALALAGPLLALMVTRGFEKESVDFYDQALQRGDILVAVEIHDEDPEPRLTEADRILKITGAKTVSLPEG